MNKFGYYTSQYIREILRTKKKYPEHYSLLDFITYYPAWIYNINSKKTPINDQRPYLPFRAVGFLNKICRKNMRVYEYGSGGSTLFFAKNSGKIISVEHDRKWYRKIIREMKRWGYTNYKISLIKYKSNSDNIDEDPSNPNTYISGYENLRGKVFKDYAQSIEAYPRDYFDIILIDGRARPSCFKHAKNKVKKGGFIILDDAERKHYSYIHKYLKKHSWPKHNFYGPSPYNIDFMLTCFWKRPT